jgi:hypothetical protein
LPVQLSLLYFPLPLEIEFSIYGLELQD